MWLNRFLKRQFQYKEFKKLRLLTSKEHKGNSNCGNKCKTIGEKEEKQAK